MDPDFDLGRDTSRIKDRADAERQTQTVEALLNRFFCADDAERCELQLLADEVGMGKTFVALGAAWSILAHLGGPRTQAHDDIRDCAKKILVIAPQNRELVRKWHQEVSEFGKRCGRTPRVSQNFHAETAMRLDEVVAALQHGSHPVVVTSTQALGARLQHYDLKRRFLLGLLFRHWGNAFGRDQRERLLKGAPDGWPTDASSLSELSDDERKRVLFEEDDLLQAIRTVDAEDNGDIGKLLLVCKEIAVPFKRDRAALFVDVERQLVSVYRRVVGALLTVNIPLVIVDEAHNWKNGPGSNSNNFNVFAEQIAPRCRRALLLTATPFQLRPEEMTTLLTITDHLQPCRTQRASKERRAYLANQRERVVEAALRNSSVQSRELWKQWRDLGKVTSQQLETAWLARSMTDARTKLDALADAAGALSLPAVDHVVLAAVKDFDPDLRALLREALRLYAYNVDLSVELGRFVVRHRRQTGHRRFGVGRGFAAPGDRADVHMLHASPGLDVHGDGELPHYLLMRCVSEMHKGAGHEKRRSSLGSALTGCYSTLLTSAEGKSVQKALASSPLGATYLELLQKSVSEDNDEQHPKMKAVVDRVLETWQRGEKVLLFCMRTQTAHQLRKIIDKRIRAELEARKSTTLGGPHALKALRTRLTSRDRDLVTLGLDRVLWSAFWALSEPGEAVIDPALLEPTEADIDAVLDVGAEHGVGADDERIDRVFFHRAFEHVIAKRLLLQSTSTPLRAVLEKVAANTWVSHPYGLEHDANVDDGGEEAASFDERGVHRVYRRRAQGERAVVDGQRRALLRSVAEGPNLWLSRAPIDAASGLAEGLTRGVHEVLRELHVALWSLTFGGTFEDVDGGALRRLHILQALRRTLLRESVLVRLLPTSADLAEEQWGELLVDAFFRALPGQSESMAARICVFLEDLLAASGDLLEDDDGKRASIFAATKLRDQSFVALVDGATKQEVRSRYFAGFNTPLLPEILVCTSVGQEGIDLHRHCRHVIHYDLAWNPAVIEQRTGRVDRIGSKTFRERDRRYASLAELPRLEIGVPFLAGTYDERMYEELRLRAQTFEILTGGELSTSDADNVEGADHIEGAEGKELGVSVVPLPSAMVRDLRVNLHVWSP